MKSKIAKVIFCCLGVGVGAGALVIVIGMVSSFLFLFSPPSPSISGPAVQSEPAEMQRSALNRDPLDEISTRPGNSPEPEPSPSRTVAAGDAVKPARKDTRITRELDREFASFMADRGMSADELQQELAAASTAMEEEAEPESETIPALSEEATQILKEEYPVADARSPSNGEVWIQVDPSEAEELSMDEIMARAAELYDDAGEPMKVVVWAGNRPRAVQTFNGHPIF